MELVPSFNQINPINPTISKKSRMMASECSRFGIRTAYFMAGDGMPQVGIKIDSKSRELVCKLVAMQMKAKDRRLLISVTPDGENAFLFLSDKNSAQSQEFIDQFITDLGKANGTVIDEATMKEADSFIRFAENKEFIPFDEKDGTCYGFYYEADSNKQMVAMHNTRFNRDNMRSNGVVEEVSNIPFDRLVEECDRMYAMEGTPKDTLLMTDEEYERAASFWCEKNPELKKTLLLLRNLGIATKGCCAGHNSELDFPLVVMILDNENKLDLINKLTAVTAQNKTARTSYTFDHNLNSYIVASYGNEIGYNEEFFTNLNATIQELMQGKENPDTTLTDVVCRYLYAINKPFQGIEFYPNEDYFVICETHDSPKYPMDMLKEMISTSKSQADFTRRFGALYPGKQTVEQGMNNTTNSSAKKGLTIASIKEAYNRIMQELGVISKDGPEDREN